MDVGDHEIAPPPKKCGFDRTRRALGPEIDQVYGNGSTNRDQRQCSASEREHDGDGRERRRDAACLDVQVPSP